MHVEAGFQAVDLALQVLGLVAELPQGSVDRLQLGGLDLGHQAGPGPFQLPQDRVVGHEAGAGVHQLLVEPLQFGQLGLVGHRERHAGLRARIARPAGEAAGHQPAGGHIAAQPLQPGDLCLLLDELPAQGVHLFASGAGFRVGGQQAVAQTEVLHLPLQAPGLGLQVGRLLCQEVDGLLQPLAPLLEGPRQILLLQQIQSTGEHGRVVAGHPHQQHPSGHPLSAPVAAQLPHLDLGQPLPGPLAAQGCPHVLEH